MTAPEEKKPEKRVPCEVYSRVVGYLRPISSWNVGKVAEFEDRVEYKIQEAT